MSFTDHKITAFTHKIADLPDEPQLPAADLKSRFDACPEELRQSLNAVCDDAARLEARVEGIVVDTFGDTITEDMLSDELAEKIDQIDTLVAHDHEIHYGFYTGDSVYPRTIQLGFQPRAVLIFTTSGETTSKTYVDSFLAVPTDNPTTDHYCVITSNGFQLTNEGRARSMLNLSNTQYTYLALA